MTGRNPEAPRPRRVGLFGGTFDPPHLGHERVASDVADALDLDRVLWVPAGAPPHKSDQALAPPASRLAMVRAAVTADARFEASAIEIERPGPSYTVDTLRALRAELGDAELYVILGADQYRALGEWREPEEILRLGRLAVMDRGGASARDARPAALAATTLERRAVFVPVTRVDLSSTGVRAAIASGAGTAGMVSEAVRRIIDRERLYRP